MKNEGDTINDQAWLDLNQRLQPERKSKLLQVSSNRTEYIRLVVQDIHHPHNVSACLRSAEAFGILHVDVVTMKESYRPSTVARGVHHWLKVHRHNDAASCALSLKKQGYKLAGAFPSKTSTELAELPIDEPLAIIFGNEHSGVHESWLPHLDYTFTIPMIGFVESLNISVSCGISLYETTTRAKRALGNGYHLSPNVRNALLGDWVRQQFPWYEKQSEAKTISDA